MFKFVTAAGLLCWFSISAAHAALITIDWSGEVHSAPGATPFVSGDSISGVFVYDDESPVDSIDGTKVIYATNHSTMFSINGLQVFGSGGTIAHDNFTVCVPFVTCVGAEELIIESNAFNGDFLGGLAVERSIFTMGWICCGGTSGNPLPSQINRAPLYISGDIFLQGEAESIRLNIGNPTFTRASAVPISATGWLLASGLMLLRLNRRRA